MPFKSAKQQGYMFVHHPEIARRWAHKYGTIKKRGTMPQNKRGQKGSTGGGGRGFGTHSQAGGTHTEEDTPGVDFRTYGNRRYNKGTKLPGGQRARVSHLGTRKEGMAGQQATHFPRKGTSAGMQKAIRRRLGLPKGKDSDIQDRRGKPKLSDYVPSKATPAKIAAREKNFSRTPVGLRAQQERNRLARRSGETSAAQQREDRRRKG